MRSRRPFLLIILFAAAILLTFFLVRRAIRADFGPVLAQCPGPDAYGYTCASGAGFAYIDATHDTQLYQDDGSTLLELPFPVTFYGTDYTQMYASSNGALQFGHNAPIFSNECLTDQVASGMGDMIAPYWDDLDLRFYGYLETETVGEAPNRIFVVEWDDVPRFGDNEDDRVTFAVQVFEGSSDIVFLYEDVTTFEGHNGSSATIGLQSEAQGLALQFSCNQAAVADAGRIYFPHPDVPNPSVGQESAAAAVASNAAAPATLLAKGIAADLITALNQRGPGYLTQLQTQWRAQSPARAAVWEWVDVTGNGRSNLILLLYGGPTRPELAQLIVLEADEAGHLGLLLDERLSNRDDPAAELSIVSTADVTNDGRPDVLILDDTGRLTAVTAIDDNLTHLSIPERCDGNLGILDGNRDGRLDIIRDGCETKGRILVSWNTAAATFQIADQP